MAKHFSVEWLSQSFYSTTSSGGFIVNLGEKSIVERNIDVSLLDDKDCTELNVDSTTQSNALDLLRERMEGNCKGIRIPMSPDSCDYTSSSESEVEEHHRGSARTSRRMRTKFSSDQIFRLEKTFHKHKYLGATKRRKIAEKLQLSETQVKTWFQNRRMKLKREIQDTRAEFFAPSILPPSFVVPASTAFQHHAVGGQLLALPQVAHHVYTIPNSNVYRQYQPTTLQSPMLPPGYY